jgi:hypothetical protein
MLVLNGHSELTSIQIAELIHKGSNLDRMPVEYLGWDLIHLPESDVGSFR